MVDKGGGYDTGRFMVVLWQWRVGLVVGDRRVWNNIVS